MCIVFFLLDLKVFHCTDKRFLQGLTPILNYLLQHQIFYKHDLSPQTMESTLHHNAILTGYLDTYCLVCESFLKAENVFKHIDKPFHTKNLDAAPYMRNYKDESIRKVSIFIYSGGQMRNSEKCENCIVYRIIFKRSTISQEFITTILKTAHCWMCVFNYLLITSERTAIFFKCSVYRWFILRYTTFFCRLFVLAAKLAVVWMQMSSEEAANLIRNVLRLRTVC